MTRHEPRIVADTDAIREMLDPARPDQIRRLIDDIRKSDRQAPAKGDMQ
jgi:hypothetical protein